MMTLLQLVTERQTCDTQLCVLTCYAVLMRCVLPCHGTQTEEHSGHTFTKDAVDFFKSLLTVKVCVGGSLRSMPSASHFANNLRTPPSHHPSEITHHWRLGVAVVPVWPISCHLHDSYLHCFGNLKHALTGWDPFEAHPFGGCGSLVDCVLPVVARLPDVHPHKQAQGWRGKCLLHLQQRTATHGPVYSGAV